MLVRCPDCGKKVSASASSCPHCGAPVKELHWTLMAKKMGYSAAITGIFSGKKPTATAADLSECRALGKERGFQILRNTAAVILNGDPARGFIG